MSRLPLIVPKLKVFYGSEQRVNDRRFLQWPNPMEVRWVRPKVVVEIAFRTVTSTGHLRHARLGSFRLDKM